MLAAEAFYFAAEFEVAADGGVDEDAEAVDYCYGAAGHFYDFFRCQVQVGLVANGEDYGSASFMASLRSCWMRKSVSFS